MDNDFEWKETYSVRCKRIDNQHKELFKNISALFHAITEQSKKKDLIKILEDLITYTTYHFATEEEYFELFEYEDAEAHK